MSADPVLTAERDHLTESRAALRTMRAATEAISDLGTDELTSHALGALRAARLAALADAPDIPPFFGRIDRPAETFHLGRRHVRDAAGDPLVIDWRAPMAQAFYRATVADAMGIRLRRRFGFNRGALTS